MISKPIQNVETLEITHTLKCPYCAKERTYKNGIDGMNQNYGLLKVIVSVNEKKRK